MCLDRNGTQCHQSMRRRDGVLLSSQPMGAPVRRGRSAAGRAEVRGELVRAALTLFTEKGYDETTVDDVAAAAGVGRRTFFRYFRGKEDAVSPDHETCLARVDEVFATAHDSEPLTPLVLRAGDRVFDLYLDNPAEASARFALTRNVPALRDREAASVDRYRRLFGRRLRERLVGRPDGELVAAVTAAAVVAAHNHALRTWLVDGARPEEADACRAAFRRVETMLPVAPDRPDDLAEIARRLERAADRLDRAGPAH
ncbi:regulatory protein TetR [Pseudonocardia dioxanivorans CB1190]|uniref:Regulatory protein TetR n=2 Tax=Pseudonocardia TaxID=1847 RepID=F4CTE7_PSEUX|nr:regulatory protein TetR [Pseudonocardia dioxanivorans CB1190]